MSRDETTGKVTATGEAKTDADKTLQAAITDETVTVVVKTTDKNTINYTPVTGIFDGNKVENDKKVTTSQIVNPNNTAKVDEIAGRDKGVTLLHEVLESYLAGQNSQTTGVSAPSTFLEVDNNTSYINAHNQAEVIDTRHKNSYTPVEKKDGYYLKNNTTGKTKPIFKY